MVAEIPKHTDILIAAEVSQRGTFFKGLKLLTHILVNKYTCGDIYK